MLTYGITGASGLLGWHTAVRLRASRATQQFHGKAPNVELRVATRATFARESDLVRFARECDVILHFAGVNRGSDAEVEEGNEWIARRLIRALEKAGRSPTVVFANSTHAGRDTPYGRAKAKARDLLQAWAEAADGALVDLVIPHVFGEGARPFYNNVTATFIKHVLDSTSPEVNPDGRVELVHAGGLADKAIRLGRRTSSDQVRVEGTTVAVPDLLEQLRGLQRAYSAGVFPDLSHPFVRNLFNAYRAALPPTGWQRCLEVRSDARGNLFEAAKGGGGGQTFVSWTHPGITRGNHFHLRKVERFVVLEGEALISLRRVHNDGVSEFHVEGASPTSVDIPTMHTHKIENVGSAPLLTLFWSHELFDPADPDTYAEEV